MALQFVLLAQSIIFSSVLISVAQASFHHVFTGTGALEVQLIAAKIALQSGDTCSIVGPDDIRQETKCISLMYGEKVGRQYSRRETQDTDDNMDQIADHKLPEFASKPQDIGNALSKADYIFICCEEKGVDDSFVNALL